MKNRGFVLRIIGTLLLSLYLVSAYAGSTPKFTIIPTTDTTFTMPANGVRVVKYIVTNLTNLPRTLAMRPMVGVSQLTSYPGEPQVCGSNFTLASKGICTLVLQIVGVATQVAIHSDVVVCLASGAIDNPTSPFLCSRTAHNLGLNVTLGPAVPVTIATAPASDLLFSVVVGGTVTVTNTSLIATAENVIGSTPTNPNIAVFSNCPAHLFPLQSCNITYNSDIVGTAQSIIQGLNTNAVTMNLQVVKPTISLSPTALSFFIGDGGTITVTNTSTNAYAQNVGAIITSGSSNFYVSANTCGSLLAPGGTCNITINAIAAGTGSLTIQGTNTDPQPPQSVSLKSSLVPISSSPADLTFAISPGSGVVTVTNNSSVVALNVTGHLPLGSSVTATTCSSIPPNGTCQITFSSPTAATVTVPIYGSNTTPTSVNLSILMPTITVAPTSLQFVNGNTASVTVSVPPSSLPVTGGVNAYPFSPIGVSSNGCTGTLNPGTGCTITFTSPLSQTTSQQSIPIYGAGTNRVGVNVTAGPAPISINPTVVVGDSSSIGSTTVTNNFVSAASAGTATNLTANVPSGANITVGGTCSTSPTLVPGGTCAFSFTPTGSIDNIVVVPIQGANTTTATLTIAPIRISISPATLTISQSTSGTVTIKQESPSTFAKAFNGVAITIPPGSAITVGQNNNCSNGIAFPASTCTIDFIGGPAVETQVITIQGLSNGVPVTNTVSFTATSLGTGSQQLSFVGSSTGIIDVENVGSTAVFEIANESTTAAANITATLPTTWTGVTATSSSDCTSLAAGSSKCTITIASSTANLAGKIEISGTSTTTLQAAVAFQKGGGLIYDISSTEVKVVDPNVQPSNPLAWGDYIQTNAISKTDGSVNQLSILNADPTAGAASFCNTYNGSAYTDWYLPAIRELNKIYFNLSTLGFASFAATYYWSSTENDIGTAWYQSFIPSSNGATNTDYKNIPYNVRCVRKA